MTIFEKLKEKICSSLEDFIKKEKFEEWPDNYIIHFDEDSLVFVENMKDIEEIKHPVVMSRRYYDNLEEFLKNVEIKYKNN